MAHGDGKSIAYDFKKAAWSSVHTNPTTADYISLYDFREAGFFGTTADVLSFRRTSQPWRWRGFSIFGKCFRFLIA